MARPKYKNRHSRAGLCSIILALLSAMILAGCIILHRCGILVFPERSPHFFYGICAAGIMLLQALLFICLLIRKTKGAYIALNLLTVTAAGMFAGLLLLFSGHAESVPLTCKDRTFIVTKYRSGPFDSLTIAEPLHAPFAKRIVSQNVEVSGQPVQNLVTVTEDQSRNLFIFTYNGKQYQYLWEVRTEDPVLCRSERSEKTTGSALQ